MAQLGWIGLGRIGLPMAERLVLSGHSLLVWDVDPNAVAAAAAFGALPAEKPGDVASTADVVFLCVPDGQAVEQVVFGADGVAAGGRPGLVIVDHTSVCPSQSQEFAERALRDHVIGWVDAPVSGGPQGARAATLAVWLGGRAEDVMVARRFLGAYCSRLVDMGGPGRGQIVKACNQLIVCTTVAAWSESFRLAQVLNVSPHELMRALEGASADSPLMQGFGRSLADGGFPERSAANMTKDLAIILWLARSHAIEAQLSAAALSEFEATIKPGGASDESRGLPAR